MGILGIENFLYFSRVSNVVISLQIQIKRGVSSIEEALKRFMVSY